MWLLSSFNTEKKRKNILLKNLKTINAVLLCAFKQLLNVGVSREKKK